MQRQGKENLKNSNWTTRKQTWIRALFHKEVPLTPNGEKWGIFSVKSFSEMEPLLEELGNSLREEKKELLKIRCCFISNLPNTEILKERMAWILGSPQTPIDPWFQFLFIL